jgi:hypothetical protein
MDPSTPIVRLEPLPREASIDDRLAAIGDIAPCDASSVAAKAGFAAKVPAQLEALSRLVPGSKAWVHDLETCVDTWYHQAIAWQIVAIYGKEGACRRRVDDAQGFGVL